jgi:xylan 1,4-beta-xylosidase
MLLHELGDERLPAPVDAALVTRRADGTLVIAAWNWVEPEVQGSDETMTFDFRGVADGVYAEVRRVDAQHGDSLDA